MLNILILHKIIAPC